MLCPGEWKVPTKQSPSPASRRWQRGQSLHSITLLHRSHSSIGGISFKLSQSHIYIKERSRSVCLFVCLNLEAKLLDGSQPNLAWATSWYLWVSSKYFFLGNPPRGSIIFEKLKKSKLPQYGPGQRAESFCGTFCGTFCTFFGRREDFFLELLILF